MTGAPERIWAEEPEVFDAMGFWQECRSAGLTEYIRADLHAAALDRIAELEAAAKHAIVAMQEARGTIVSKREHTLLTEAVAELRTALAGKGGAA